MPILLAISILAFAALLWASISIAQHIRKARRASPASAVLLVSELLEDDAIAPDISEESPQLIAAMPQTSAVLQEPVTTIATPSLPETYAATVATVEPSTLRKFPPAAAHPGRVDWAYFKEDMGDLTDPLPAHPKLRQRAR